MHKLLLLLDTNSQKKMNSRKKNTDIDDDGDTSLSVKMLNFSLVKICKFIWIYVLSDVFEWDVFCAWLM